MKNNKIRYLIIMILSFIAICILEIFICKTALALEIVMPSSSQNINGTMYYGYNIPNRPTATEANTNYINIQETSKRQNGNIWDIIYSKNFDLKTRYVDNDIIDYLNLHDISINQNVWTDTFSMDTIYNRQYNNVSFAIHPGASASTFGDMLDNGYLIDYDGYYSYTFDFIIYNKYGLEFKDNFNKDYFLQYCKTYELNGVDTFGCSTAMNNYVLNNVIYEDSNIKYYRYTIYFNINSMFGFTYDTNPSSNNTNQTGYFANYAFTIASELYNRHFEYFTKIVISQPYDISVWNNYESLYCQDSCWTQNDTNNHSDTAYSESDILDNFNKKFDDLNYHGFNGIVNLTFDFIKDLLSDTNTSCVDLNIPIHIRNKTININLPNSCTFWGRQDITTFETFYHLMWYGIIGYVLCWRIYKDIIKLYTPGASIIDGNEVDDL